MGEDIGMDNDMELMSIRFLSNLGKFLVELHKRFCYAIVFNVQQCSIFEINKSYRDSREKKTPLDQL
jgi:hypothetical protein